MIPGLFAPKSEEAQLLFERLATAQRSGAGEESPVEAWLRALGMAQDPEAGVELALPTEPEGDGSRVRVEEIFAQLATLHPPPAESDPVEIDVPATPREPLNVEAPPIEVVGGEIAAPAAEPAPPAGTALPVEPAPVADEAPEGAVRPESPAPSRPPELPQREAVPVREGVGEQDVPEAPDVPDAPELEAAAPEAPETEEPGRVEAPVEKSVAAPPRGERPEAPATARVVVERNAAAPEPETAPPAPPEAPVEPGLRKPTRAEAAERPPVRDDVSEPDAPEVTRDVPRVRSRQEGAGPVEPQPKEAVDQGASPEREIRRARVPRGAEQATAAHEADRPKIARERRAVDRTHTPETPEAAAVDAPEDESAPTTEQRVAGRSRVVRAYRDAEPSPTVSREVPDRRAAAVDVEPRESLRTPVTESPREARLAGKGGDRVLFEPPAGSKPVPGSPTPVEPAPAPSIQAAAGGSEVPAAQTSAPVPRVHHQALAESIVARARQVPENGSVEVRFALEPEHLGHVRVEITSRGDQLKIRILTASGAAADVIGQGLAKLSQELSDTGRVPTIDIAVDDTLGTGSEGRSETGRQAAGDRRPRSTRIVSAEPRPAARPTRQSHSNEDGQLDRTA